ncbi:MAG TPA: N-acetyl-gamma-glutamyl-phosphate reductase [Thermoplasmata archaeon]|nr:N-acetyl-gamma-glutamyl-phosphate reductase [Thermoplasmata archaeon]HUJ77862.1 N-acetyl-gamma-glutamyl-phosphate reductase [Thermoplasmata archaeon]
MATAAVIGASGYLGTELLRVLSYHPDLHVTQAVSRSHPGETVASVAPQLEGYDGLRLTADPSAVDADVAFIAEPAGEAMRVAPALLDRGIRVVDLGPDYRLGTPEAYEAAYGQPHADPDHLARAVYGLPELFRDAIRSARLVANPGCYPTASLLALAPLVRDGAIAGPIVIDAKSGTSGAGSQPTASSHHPDAALTVRPYGSPSHRHAPEMRRVLATIAPDPPPIVFVPHLVPLVRGILASVYAPPSRPATADAWSDRLRTAYEGRPFVRVGAVPRLPWAAGTNRCYLSVQAADGFPVVFSALDNLGKGGAGQAVQNANLLFGWDEARGLVHSGFGV